MDIQPIKVTVRELTDGFEDNDENGVLGYGGKLDIRPPYQREFIYEPKERDAVIDTLIKDYPLNIMYWSVKEDGTFEVIDGQQRTISISQFVEGDFAFNDRYFHNLQKDEKEQILNYELTVYLCSGTDTEKLEWFKTINIAGKILTDQELLNAVYSGSWVSDAKRYFSKTGCPAYAIGSRYIVGKPIRQDYLKTAIKWISDDAIKQYMAQHQHEPNANELWLYFQSVINWIKAVFPKYRPEMKGVQWGFLYNKYYKQNFDSKKLEEEITLLMQDEDVTNKKGIYTYVLTRKEKHLSLRAFTDNQKREAYEKQEGICVKCGEKFEFHEMEGDHVIAWSQGGKTTADNCQMLCKEDNNRKSGK
ncbi:DUF262 domain-containing protein [Pontibacter sp. FD36]|uniref:GmrSD restriction endonuclease domain-containing protein n=1 Tax=Pontibacter sp. FD36 TaxID=2789860 RepID=UPI0018A9B4D4|nr:DUF262 domain-containing protein [Pontibacter sp. FD36]MBF8962323.1 DUF262 domain-containing protein [Pontibacter sp. FD36]